MFISLSVLLGFCVASARFLIDFCFVAVGSVLGLFAFVVCCLWGVCAVFCLLLVKLFLVFALFLFGTCLAFVRFLLGMCCVRLVSVELLHCFANFRKGFGFLVWYQFGLLGLFVGFCLLSAWPASSLHDWLGPCWVLVVSPGVSVGAARRIVCFFVASQRPILRPAPSHAHVLTQFGPHRFLLVK